MSVVLPAPGRPGQELKGLRRDLEGQIAQDLRAHAVAQADILEADQVVQRPRPVRLLNLAVPSLRFC